MIDRSPEKVRFRITKASHYLCYLDEPDEALECIDHALRLARRTGYFRREVLGKRARILLELDRADELPELLEEITSLRIVRDIPDIGRERDFVDRAPPGVIPANLLARYNEFCPPRPTRDGPDESPELEPASDF